MSFTYVAEWLELAEFGSSKVLLVTNSARSILNAYPINEPKQIQV